MSEASPVSCRGSGAHIAVEPGVYLVPCPECRLLMPLEDIRFERWTYAGIIVRH